LHSFGPIADLSAQILILGSMPSVKSLQKQQYYAHPQNSFWWIMAQLCGFENVQSYAERVSMVKKSGVAVWDVLAQCERQGSLDSKIERASERANDLPAFFSQHKYIKLIGFNGMKARQIFYRHFSQNLLDSYSINNVLLPSTSPANAGQTKQQKHQTWQNLLLG